jgi:hypothetical protein
MSIAKTQNNDTTILTIFPEYKPIHKVMGVFISLWMLGVIYSLFMSVKLLVNGEIDIFFFMLGILFFWLAYHIIFFFCWGFFGKEIIIIESKSIKYTKSFWILRRTKKFWKSNINELKVVDRSDSIGASGNKTFGFSNVHIQFFYKRKLKMIGKQINKEEADQILKEFQIT